jgi:hypothetical protein
MVGEVKAAVNPNAIFGDGNVLLRIHRPLARQRNLFVDRRLHFQGERVKVKVKVEGEGGGAETTNYMLAVRDRRG